MPDPIRPPDLDEVRALLRPSIAALPDALAGWPAAEGLLADVPLLHPRDVDPWAFTELSGTVRVAATTPSLLTLAGLLELPDEAGVLVTAVAAGPEDLAQRPDDGPARQALAAEGARRRAAAPGDVAVEVVALLAPVDGRGGPVAGVGIVRPLLLADPARFAGSPAEPAAGGAQPAPVDPALVDAALAEPALVDAARTAVAEDREVVADLAGDPLRPLEDAAARIWSPLFSVARAATIGLAARGAGT